MTVLSQLGLSYTQLLPIVENAAGTSVAHFRVASFAPMIQNQGVCGDKFLLHFTLTTPSGLTSQVEVFVKKFNWKTKSEAAHYRYLAAAGVPMPKLYGTIQHSDGDEILFLERLTSIGYDRHSESEWRELLSLLACYNACPVPQEAIPHLYPFEQGGKVGGWWITGFGALPPARDEIEKSLRHCGVGDDELARLCSAAQTLCGRVAALPRGLLHQDFLPDNFGWRGGHESMVVFDVHKSCLGPRFADAAPYLGVPDWSNTAVFLDELPDRRQRLTQHYLDEYARFGGEQVSIETFQKETSLLFWAHKVAVLWWLAEQNDTPRIVEIRDYLRNCADTAL